MDGNLQKQDIKKSFTFDTKKKTDLYDSIFKDSLYTVDKQDEVKQKDYKEQINELREREKMMERATVFQNPKYKNEEQKPTGRQMVMGRLNDFKHENDMKMSDLVGTETSTKFYDNVEAEEVKFKSKLNAFKAKDLLKNAKYLVKGKKAKKTKHSPSMQAVLDRMDELQQVLSWKVAQSDDLFDAQVGSITSVMRQTALACCEYLDTHNSSRAEGVARKNLVQLIYDQISKESVMFEKRLKDYKAQRTADNRPMWLDIFADMRIEKIVPGNGVTITRGGAGTSDLIIVEKDGVKHYLKKEETVPGLSGNDVFNAYADNLNKKIKLYSDDKAESLKNIPKEEREKKLEYLKLDKATMIMLKNALGKCISVGQPGYSVMSENNAEDLLYALRDLTSSSKYFISTLINKKSVFSKTELGKTMIKLNNRYVNAKNKGDTELQKQLIGYADRMYNVAKDLFKSLNAADIAIMGVKIDEGSSLSKRNVATSRLAEFLGIGHLVAKSEMKDVMVDGEYMRCIEMEDAGSTNMRTYEKDENNYYKKGNAGIGGNAGKRFSYSSECLKDILSLQVFDLICGQTDRHKGNYMGNAESTEEEIVLKKVKGIDNDMCFGKLSYERVKKGGPMALKPVEDEKGRFSLPAMDKKLAAKIMAVTPSMLDYLMADLLSKKEREALKDRFKGVQNAIRRQQIKEADLKQKSKKFRSKFISKKEDWDAVKAELQNKAKSKRGREEIKNTTYLDTKWMGNKIEKYEDEDGNVELVGVAYR